MILGIIASAVLSGQRGIAAIAHWTQRQRRPLLRAFRPARGRLPSESTLRRALQRIDVTALEQQVAAVVPPATPARGASAPAGHAIDGKHVRGAGTQGQPTVLVSLVAHADAHVVAQTAVAHKRHESQAVPVVLDGRDLHGIVITLDAGLTHPKLAAQILAQGGDYLMVVKRNQHQLYDELGWFFDTPPLPCDRPWRTVRTVNKGHGRLETRQLTCTDDLEDYVRWPGVRQVLQRVCERVTLKTGQVTRAMTYGMTSLDAQVGPPAVLAALWRGHWTIENRRHYIRDVTLGEDACQVHSGHAPQALAALRNAVISVLRGAGWHNIAAGIRHYSTSIHDTLRLIGVPCRGL